MSKATSLAGWVRRWSEEKPRDIAYHVGGRALDWRGYDNAADRLARHLVDLEIPADERIGVWMPDGTGVHVAFQGCERAGRVALGLGARCGLHELRHLLGLANCGVLISAPIVAGTNAAEQVDSLRADGLSIRHHVVLEADGFVEDRILIDGEWCEAESTTPLAGRGLGPDEVFLFNSTSGTTGLPKIVIHDQRRWMEFHRYAKDVGRLTSDDVILSAVPAPFGFGLWTSHVTPTLLGVPTVVMPRFDAAQAVTLLERHAVTMLAAVSTQFIMMLESGALDRDPALQLRALFTGGEAVPFERAKRFEEKTGAHVLQFYGSNETGAVSATRIEDPVEKRLGTAGRPIAEMNLRLFNGVGEDVTSEGRGQPAVRGPVLSRGYFGAEEANAELIREDGWVLLGDLVEIDADGYLRVVGRTDDIIIRGGKNLSAAAIEEAVALHPEIAIVGVIGIPDPVFGEKAAAYVELSSGGALTLPALVTFLEAESIARELWPEALVVLDAMPQNVGGKVAKRRLRDDADTRFSPGLESGDRLRAEAASRLADNR